VKIDRRFIVAGLPLGPLVVLVGYAVLLKSGAVISDLMLCLLLVWPTAVLLVGAAVAAVCRGGRDSLGFHGDGRDRRNSGRGGGGRRNQRYRVDDLRPGMSSRRAALIAGPRRSTAMSQAL
jgi:hypothetical protein